MRIGVLAPGAMGSALGRTWQRGGHQVCTTVAGRSERTRALAEGLDQLDSVAAVVAASEVVVSVVPPDRAVANATTIAEACRAAGAHPVLIEVNAIAPARVTEIAEIWADCGQLVDGSVSGPPPDPGARTTLYLSGPELDWADQLATEELAVRVVGSRVGLASAVKMSTAAMYKGISALWLQSLSAAAEFGVTDVVVADLLRGLGRTPSGLAHELAVAASKSDRFPGEMREIAATQEQAGLGPELYTAIAEVYQRVNGTALAGRTPEQAAEADDLDQVLDELSGRSRARSQ